MKSVIRLPKYIGNNIIMKTTSKVPKISNQEHRNAFLNLNAHHNYLTMPSRRGTFKWFRNETNAQNRNLNALSRHY